MDKIEKGMIADHFNLLFLFIVGIVTGLISFFLLIVELENIIVNNILFRSISTLMMLGFCAGFHETLLGDVEPENIIERGELSRYAQVVVFIVIPIITIISVCDFLLKDAKSAGDYFLLSIFVVVVWLGASFALHVAVMVGAFICGISILLCDKMSPEEVESNEPLTGILVNIRKSILNITLIEMIFPAIKFMTGSESAIIAFFLSNAVMLALFVVLARINPYVKKETEIVEFKSDPVSVGGAFRKNALELTDYREIETRGLKRIFNSIYQKVLFN